MGKLKEGIWSPTSIITSDNKGGFSRPSRSFRYYIRKDDPSFPAETNRYHLYVSLACPWAHRTLIYRKLKNLEDHISVDVVHPDLLSNGWEFNDSFESCTSDRVLNSKFLYEIYQKSDPKITTTVTVPILFDKVKNTIVNNESSEIIRIFNQEFNHLTQNDLDFYPLQHRDEINELNELIYHNINNGVYKTGFSTNQDSYDQSVSSLFNALDDLEKRLEGKDYLIGNTLTEADLRLIPTLLRFDVVYFTHFKCNIKRIVDYPNLSRYIQNLYQLDAVKSTTDFEHIKRHYYYSHKDINPFRIIPKGPRNIF